MNFDKDSVNRVEVLATEARDLLNSDLKVGLFGSFTSHLSAGAEDTLRALFGTRACKGSESLDTLARRVAREGAKVLDKDWSHTHLNLDA